MRLRRLLAPLFALMLVIPVATAYGAETDQNVDVMVLQPGSMSIEVDHTGFGVMVPNTEASAAFRLRVVSTSSTGWEVTVTDSGAFTSGEWEYCDESGCNNWIEDGGATIPIENLSIEGGDLPWWDDHDTEVIVPYSGSFGSGAVTLQTGTAEAFGDFEINDPSPELTLLVPDGTPTHHYATTLTYTLMALP